MDVVLVGYGRMGAMIESLLLEEKDVNVLGVVDTDLFRSPLDVPGRADVLMDFSYPGNLRDVLEYADRTGCALVIGTTGYSEKQREQIYTAAKTHPVVFTSNFSLGVAALRRAVKLVAPLLGEAFDVEIVETHHNRKADAPSGTAKMLLDAVDPAGKLARVYGREGLVGPRGREIGVHAIRGGTVAGEHSVQFFGDDEVVTLSHCASSRRVFARGAVRAARFAPGRAPGLYEIEQLLRAQEEKE